MIDRVTPTLRPSGRPAGFQRWRELLFLHWEVPVDAVAKLVPPDLTIDTFEGKAYVGVVPFTMRDVSPRWSPSVPGISNFHELNVRTYVHHKGKNPGVWFFSLDAAATIAVLVARAGWSLPYYRAWMSLEKEGVSNEYRSRRLFGPGPAKFHAKYEIGESIGPAKPDTFEHFLAERYILYTQTKKGLLRGHVHHTPYPLRKVTLGCWEESVISAAGLERSDAEPHALYAEGVDVDVFALKKV
jgi:uncharacterized protein